jgi:hypothetical protein
MAKMHPNEFREIGLLQEVNRLFLHPFGLALGIEDDGTFIVLDNRDDKEGMVFADADGNSTVDPAKVERVQALLNECAQVRVPRLGWLLQPPGPEGNVSPEGMTPTPNE